MQAKINLYHVALTDTSHVKSAAQSSNRLANTLRFRFGFGGCPTETGKELVKQSNVGTDKFGILSKAQLFDHIGRNALRFQHPELTIDPRCFRRCIAQYGSL